MLSRWPWWRRWFGERSERAAARFLQRRGHRILARNLRNRQGELDLVTRANGWLAIVEVRSTAADDDAGPLASIDAEKQHRLTRATLAFAQQHGLLRAALRFDVVTVCWPEGQREPTIRHYEHAFEATV